MPNAWVEHVKKFAKENNETYGCAISNPKCKESYKSAKAKPMAAPTAAPRAATPPARERMMAKPVKPMKTITYKPVMN